MFPQALSPQRKRRVHPSLTMQTLQAHQYTCKVAFDPRKQVKFVRLTRKATNVRGRCNHRTHSGKNKREVLRSFVLPPLAYVPEGEI